MILASCWILVSLSAPSSCAAVSSAASCRSRICPRDCSGISQKKIGNSRRFVRRFWNTLGRKGEDSLQGRDKFGLRTGCSLQGRDKFGLRTEDGGRRTEGRGRGDAEQRGSYQRQKQRPHRSNSCPVGTPDTMKRPDGWREAQPITPFRSRDVAVLECPFQCH